MKKINTILLFLLSGYSSILLSQTSRFQVADLEYAESDKMTQKCIYFERKNDSISYLLANDIPIHWGKDTMRETHILYTLQNGQLKDRKILMDSCRRFLRCFKIGDKYLYAGIDFNYQDHYKYAYLSYVYDQNFNLVKDTAIILDDEGYYCFYDYIPFCGSGGEPVIYKKGDSTYLFTSLNFENDSIKLVSVKYDKDLDITFFKNEKWRKAFANYAYQSNEDLFTLVKQPDKDTFNLIFNGCRVGLDHNFNVLYWYYIPSQLFRISAIGLQQHTIVQDSFLVFGGMHYQPSQFENKTSFGIGKYSKNWRFNFNDSVHLQTYFNLRWPEEAIKHPYNGLIKLADGNYLGIVCYYSPITYDTTCGRVLIAKFTPNLQVLCQKTFVFDFKDVLLDYVYNTPIGNKYIVAGIVSKIREDGASLPYYPFATYFDTDCNLPGATPLEDYLGLSNKAIQRNVYGIQLYPNPTSSYLHLSTVTPLHDPQAQIHLYDMMGGKLRTVPWKVEDAYIDMQDIPPGVYICTVSTGAGVVFAKSFVKQ